MHYSRHALGLVAATAVALPLQAQTAPATVAYDAPGITNTGNFSFEATADIVSVYMFRGYEQTDNGIILQPGASIGTDLGDTGFDLTLGTWHSFHTDHTGSGASSPSSWYEADFYATVGYELDQFSLSATLTGYYSPAGNFGDIEEISFTAEYDDSAYLEEWAVNPYATLAFEIRDSGGSEDIYLEIGGAVGAPFIDSESMGVEMSFPFAIGFSLDDYYQDAGGSNETWGFLRIGAEATMDLDMIPAEYGAWTGTVGLDLWFVNEDANLLDSGDDFQPVLRAGVALTY
ncbi:MAG: hypothetical protein V3V20_03205 [Algisphaera sp.]